MDMLTQFNPSVVLPVFMILGGDVLGRAQSIPGPAPFSTGWPTFLLNVLGRNRPALSNELPSTVINVKTGYARTNHSATLEHLLRSHNREPTHRGLTLTFLYTSQFPQTPDTDLVSRGAILTSASQLATAAALQTFGLASEKVLMITAAGTLLPAIAGAILRHQQQKEIRTARPVFADQRDIVCITSGNGSSDVVVVVSEGGGVRLEDLAAGRTGAVGAMTTVGIAALLILWSGMLVALTTLQAADAWSVLALCALGTAHTVVASRTWRGPSALGFKFVREQKVHGDKVMQALMEAEDVERGVGLALLPVFFPGPLRPKEEEWWAGRKAALTA